MGVINFISKNDKEKGKEITQRKIIFIKCQRFEVMTQRKMMRFKSESQNKKFVGQLSELADRTYN